MRCGGAGRPAAARLLMARLNAARERKTSLDKLTKDQRSALMSRVRSRDTRPELIVRRSLHAMGFRYRLHSHNLPGKPDVVLSRWRTVVLVHGCFWHCCPSCDRGRRRPKTNEAFWEDKLFQNRERDQRTMETLQNLGWKVLVVWQCETKNLDLLRQRLRAELGS